MTIEIAIILGILAATVVLFITEKLRVDLVALLVMGVLIAIGVLSPQEGVAGFANPATVTVGAMFVLSAGLQRTGAVNELGRTLVRITGSDETRLTAGFMGISATVSAFINNTAAVAVFLPLGLNVSREAGFSPSRLLMPISFAAMFGGVCTLIGTSTNILIAAIATEQQVATFGMFEFLPLGLIGVAVGTAYMLLIGRRLIPDREPIEPYIDRYNLRTYLTEVAILPDSPLVGQTVEDAQLGTKFDLTIIEIIRDRRDIRIPGRERRLLAGDHLLVHGNVKTIMELRDEEGWELISESDIREEDLIGDRDSYVIAEAAIAPQSSLVGQTLRTSDFRRRYRAIVIGIERRGEPIREAITDVTLQPGDLLLLYGTGKNIDRLHSHTDFLMLVEVPSTRLRQERAPVAIGIVALVVLAAALEWIPIVGAAVLGCIVMIVAGVLTLEEAYEALDAQVLVMLAGILSLGTAMEKTGTAQYLADITVSFAGTYGPIALLAAFYAMTSLLTETMSNNATAVLMAPITISVAAGLGVDPKPFLVAVTFAASSSFMTPIGYQTNTMIYGPGGYRFFDFTRVGAPLNILFWIVATVMIPIIWPF